MEHFFLSWNNFTENIQNGFKFLFTDEKSQDVTLVVEGKFLKAHKVVLQICSPYFQRIFTHVNHPQPVIVLSGKEMKFNLCKALLEFIYLGKISIEQDSLQDFISIAETLQIKGLASMSKDINKVKEVDTESLGYTKSGIKRPIEEDEECNEEKKGEITDLTKDDDDFQLPMPEITIVEHYNSNNIKNREIVNQQYLKISAAQSLNRFSPYDFNQPSMPIESQMKFNEVPNESSEGSGITMLSSTSLLHGNCVFNRNNTVATQAGLKTYWLCKSYRISMCKARCITFKGKVISATGIHNHPPHMNNKPTELPPGHHPNSFNPSPEIPMSSMSTQQPFMTPQLTIPNIEASENPHFKMENI